MPELSGARWEELRRDLSARLAVFRPDWTESNETDPGITIVELFDFLAESLLSRADLSPRARTRLGEVLQRLECANDPDCRDGTLTRKPSPAPQPATPGPGRSGRTGARRRRTVPPGLGRP